MNIDKIIAKGLQYRYLDRVENALNERGLTFTDLKNCLKVGSSKFGKSDSVYKNYFGNDSRLPLNKKTCLCGHKITAM